MTLNDLERRNSPYFAFFPTKFDRFSGRLYHSGWNYNVRKILSNSSSLLLLAKTITHPAARFLCDNCWASCRSFRRRWGDCCISQDCSRSQSPQCAQYVRPLLITMVCMCIIWKALCQYVLDAQIGLWVSLEHAFTCVSTANQAERCSSATHLLAGWEQERTTAWWSREQGGGPSVIPTAGIH